MAFAWFVAPVVVDCWGVRHRLTVVPNVNDPAFEAAVDRCWLVRDAGYMKTSLIVDDDVLEAANRIAHERGVPVGAVISELARRGLASTQRVTTRNGIRLFPVREGAGSVTPEIVRKLLDESA